MKIKDLKPGEKFKYSDIEFVALGEEQGGILAVAVEPLRRIPFDIDNKNDWRTSSLRRYLNNEYLEKIDTSGLMEYESDLTSDDGMTNYGISYDKVFLLSADLYRKYRYLIPKWETWVWLITPDSCLEKYASIERGVDTDGSLNSIYCVRDTSGAVPACLFNPNYCVENITTESAYSEEIQKLKAEIAEQKSLVESLNTKMIQLNTRLDKLARIVTD